MSPRIFILIALSYYTSLTEAYNIHINNIPPTKEKVLLARYYGQKLIPVDSASTQNNTATFSGNSPLTEALYAFIVNGQSTDLLVTNEQNLQCSLYVEDNVGFLKVTGSSESAHFADFGYFMFQMQKERTKLYERFRPYQNQQDSMQLLQQRMEHLSVKVDAFYRTSAKEFDGTFLGNVYAVLQQNDAPSVLNRKQQHFYLKNHYFDEIPFTDGRLVNTPMLENKIKTYLNQVLEQIPDTLIKYTHKLLDAGIQQPEVFKQSCNLVFSYAAGSDIMGMDKLLVSISEKYYLSGKAFWVDETFKQKLARRVAITAPTLQGSVAPNINLPALEEEAGHIALHDVRAKYTLIVFWEPNCGHCAQAIPAIQKISEHYPPQQLTVYAVNTQRDLEAWKQFVFEHNLQNWLNVCDKFNQSNYKAQYDLAGTPYLVLLDTEKRVLAKEFAYQDLHNILQRLEKTGSVY